MVGIYNFNNTCYVNTALQCLSVFKPFVNIIFEYNKHDRGDIVKELHKLYMAILVNNETYDPRSLLRVLQEKIPMMNIYEQNDINEFLYFFLDVLGKDVGMDISDNNDIMPILPSNASAYQKQKYKMDVDWINKIKKEYSHFVPLFNGQQISQIVCNNCSRIWHNYDLFVSVSVALSKDTLEGCLEDYFADNVLSEWRCDDCKVVAEGSVQSVIHWRNPGVLIIVLKRFEFGDNMTRKNNKDIDIPMSLDLGRYTLGSKLAKYELKSVGLHHGSYMGGHYQAACYDGGAWTLYDDESVYKIDKPDMKKAYVLFYGVV